MAKLEIESYSNILNERNDLNEETFGEEKDEKRESWNNRFEFLLACIGISVGLGNVWRFGYLCAKSGGGAFLIPYLTLTLTLAIPLLYMEFSVGQFTQKGPIGAMRKICPLLKGTGIASIIILFLHCTYYIVILVWALYFIFSSFTYEVPWKSCNNTWNTIECWDSNLNSSLNASNIKRSPSEEFFRRKLLNESDSFENLGFPKLDLFIILVFAWILVYFCIWKGIRATGKVLYVTALFPYVILVIFLIRGATLDGAEIGLKAFFLPKWKKILEPKIWAYAVIQNFSSIGVVYGGIFTLSSYNKQNKPILSNVLAIAFIDLFTSILCGAAVFCVLGYIAKFQSKDIDDILEQGPGLVFMVFPEAIRNMSLSPMWSILFFLMIFMLGIDTQFTMVETVVTTINDECGYYVKKYLKHKEVLVLLVCGFTFLLCIPNICPGGIYYFTIIDYFSSGVPVFYIAFFETIAIVWIYGAKRLAKNVKVMTGYKPNLFFLICWYFFTPLMVLSIWIINWIEYTPITYGNYHYSNLAMTFGWCIALSSILAIPAAAAHTILTSDETTFIKKLKLALRPTIPDLDDKIYLNQEIELKPLKIDRIQTIEEK